MPMNLNLGAQGDLEDYEQDKDSEDDLTTERIWGLRIWSGK